MTHPTTTTDPFATLRTGHCTSNSAPGSHFIAISFPTLEGMQAAHQELINALTPKAPPIGRWVSVEERLPTAPEGWDITKRLKVFDPGDDQVGRESFGYFLTGPRKWQVEAAGFQPSHWWDDGSHGSAA